MFGQMPRAAVAVRGGCLSTAAQTLSHHVWTCSRGRGLDKRVRFCCRGRVSLRSHVLAHRFFPNVPPSSNHPPSLLIFVGTSKNAYPVPLPAAPPPLNASVIGSYCLYVQGELLRSIDPKKSMQIFTAAASLHNSSALLQSIASVYYSSGEVAGAYYALHAAALEEGEGIARVQFWQMYVVPRACLLCPQLSRPSGMAAPRS